MAKVEKVVKPPSTPVSIATRMDGRDADALEGGVEQEAHGAGSLRR